MKNKKKYYIPGVDKINQLVETPASKAKTEKRRFVVMVAIAAISAFAAIVAAVFAMLSFFD